MITKKISIRLLSIDVEKNYNKIKYFDKTNIYNRIIFVLHLSEKLSPKADYTVFLLLLFLARHTTPQKFYFRESFI